MIVVGGQWGDEGKGKMVAYLALRDKPAIVARAGVGPNAGHSVLYNGKKYGLRQVPCGFVYKEARLLIGPGVLVNPQIFLQEVENTGVNDRIGVDKNCAIIEPKHIEEDKTSAHLKEKIGTTGTGCGPANVARVNRTAKLAREIPELAPFLCDVPSEINEAIKRGEFVIVEGSQGFGLSLIHGTYPYVTSKDTTASTFAADVGLGPSRVDDVMIIFKAYTSRVGEGPFPTEIPQDEAERMGIVEYGTVTGRRRRIGLFDFELAKRAVMINGATQIAITCIDRLFPSARGARRWEDLPVEAREFIRKVEEATETPITLISVGPEIFDVIDLREKSR